MDDESTMLTYFENMSRAYAQLCELYVSVITPNLNDIPSDGIWATIEEPELKRTTNLDPPRKRVDTVSLFARFPWSCCFIDERLIKTVTQIEAFTPNLNESKVLFERPNTPRRDLPALASRSPPGNLPNCVPAGTVEERFGDINW
jgi:hypothetical protein